MKYLNSTKKILILNLGSSSVKGSIYEFKNRKPILVEQFSKKLAEIKNIRLFLNNLINLQHKINITVFRVVHGGRNYPSAQILTKNILAGIKEGEKLAPIHNQIMLNWYKVIKTQVQKNMKCIACFDSSFFYDLPEVSKTYPIPSNLSKKYGIQKLGFHGFAHQSMLRQFEKFFKNKKSINRVITLQLGGGSSIAAFLNDKPIDTSMGFSPLDGLMMSTRSGSIDPGILIYLLKSGFSVSTIETMLNFDSGIKGISNIADYQNLIQHKSKKSQLAVDLYCRSIAKFLGAYITLLGGVDGIVFGGGIGENCHITQKKIMQYFQYLGVDLKVNLEKNDKSPVHIISTSQSQVYVAVIKPNEEAEMLNAVKSLVISNML